jgi:hypothetical protein
MLLYRKGMTEDELADLKNQQLIHQTQAKAQRQVN